MLLLYRTHVFWLFLVREGQVECPRTLFLDLKDKWSAYTRYSWTRRTSGAEVRLAAPENTSMPCGGCRDIPVEHSEIFKRCGRCQSAQMSGRRRSLLPLPVHTRPEGRR